ncbi:RNA-binding motif, single-stranded-interacting protein 1-like [Corticium candelabrum]|uniref:RNA-binding motif, single-stranded-interacting protein 1-like n=1 Tax=Corticium candelabrum TaxID=121492 RepID=UPI002E275CFF|nr:RNA-binding motif, single-stranded-interacting protein 1-like [Corticium candelabrum]
MQEPEKAQHEGMAEGDEALGQTPVQSEDVESAQQPSLVNGVEAKDVEVERSGEDGVSEGLQEDDRDDKKVASSRGRVPHRRYLTSGRQTRTFYNTRVGRPAGPINPAAWQQQQAWQSYIHNQRYANAYMSQYGYANPYTTTSWYRGDFRPSSVGSPHGLHLVSRSQPQQEQLSATNIYIRALAPDTKDEDLEELCREYGEISSVKAIIDKNSGDCKGYGFVDFVSHDDAKRAVEQLKRRSLQAQFAKLTANDPQWKRQQEADPTNLYLQNLPKTLDEKQLEQMLTPYGKVVSTRIMKDPMTNLSKGVGFARMSAKEQCDEIIKKFNGTTLAGADQPLVCKFAEAASNKRRFHTTPMDHRRLSGDAELLNEHQRIGHQRTLGNTMMPGQYVQGIPSPQGSYHMAHAQPNWMQTQQGYIVQPAVQSPTVTVANHQSMDQNVHYTNIVPHLTSQMQHMHLSSHSIPQQQQHQSPYVATQLQHPPQQSQWALSHHQGPLMHLQTEDGVGLVHSSSDASPDLPLSMTLTPQQHTGQTLLSPTDHMSPQLLSHEDHLQLPNFNYSGHHAAWPTS